MIIQINKVIKYQINLYLEKIIIIKNLKYNKNVNFKELEKIEDMKQGIELLRNLVICISKSSILLPY